MKTSFISTIFNEEATIENFLDSILNQSKKPDEIIIVDAGSTDQTAERIKDISLRIKKYNVKFMFLIKKGNRSVGRNEAIRLATRDIIVCSDAGNILDTDWIKHITEPFEDKSVAVVAGYYKGLAKTVFQKCIVPYALVMPDKIDPHNFLPATRSVAFTKAIWKNVGGFDEALSHNEDYVFAKAIQKAHVKIVFAKNAIVYWIPRTSFKQSFVMFFRFAYGDAEAGIFRPKVSIIFLRYLIGILLIILVIIVHAIALAIWLLIIIVVYCLWAVWKNYHYVKQWQAFLILPALQIVSDVAVITGTLGGILKIWDIKKTS